MSIVKGPKDTSARHFSSSCYIFYCSNGEEQNINWVVYSKELDKKNCFCSKLLGTSCRMNRLANEGLMIENIFMKDLKNMNQALHTCLSWVNGLTYKLDLREI